MHAKLRVFKRAQSPLLTLLRGTSSAKARSAFFPPSFQLFFVLNEIFKTRVLQKLSFQLKQQQHYLALHLLRFDVSHKVFHFPISLSAAAAARGVALVSPAQWQGEKRLLGGQQSFHLSFGNWRSITFFAFRGLSSAAAAKKEKKENRKRALASASTASVDTSKKKRKSHHILSNFVRRPQKFLLPFLFLLLFFHTDCVDISF